jgi:hypothetical protein
MQQIEVIRHGSDGRRSTLFIGALDAYLLIGHVDG